MSIPSESLETTLESMVDKRNLCEIVALLGIIAEEKAVHIETEWQDKTTAKPWRKASKMLDKLAHELQAMGL